MQAPWAILVCVDVHFALEHRREVRLLLCYHGPILERSLKAADHERGLTVCVALLQLDDVVYNSPKARQYDPIPLGRQTLRP